MISSALNRIQRTTSSAFILGQVSQSIEPYFSNVYVKDVAKAKVTIRNPYLKKVLESYGKDNKDTWNSIRSNDGSVQHLDFLTQHEKDVFKTFAEIDQYVVLEQASMRQKFIDQGQSLNIMVNPQMSVKEINELHIFAWENEIKLLLQKVEEVSGHKVTPESLDRSIKLINNKRKALARLYNTRKNSPVPISGKDALLISQIAFYDDPERFAKMTNDLCDELEASVQKGEGVLSKNAPRILITGTPMAVPNWKLHHILESSGAAVVAEETCTGVRYFENLVDEKATTLDGQIRALAERYMKINCACFTPNSGRLDDIIRLAKEYKADGVVDYTLQFCGLYSTESYNVQKTLKAAGIPILHIETDYSEQDAEQIRTRVQAFLEMIS